MTSYIDKNLLTGEEIIYRTKKHFIIFFSPVLLTIITGFFFVNENSYVVELTFLPGMAALFSWANEILTYMTSEFAVTTKRIMMKEGFFFRHSNETRLSAIANVSVGQGPLGQILNYGNIVINAFGGRDDVFIQIENPYAFQKAAQEQLNKNNNF